MVGVARYQCTDPQEGRIQEGQRMGSPLERIQAFLRGKEARFSKLSMIKDVGL